MAKQCSCWVAAAVVDFTCGQDRLVLLHRFFHVMVSVGMARASGYGEALSSKSAVRSSNSWFKHKCASIQLLSHCADRRTRPMQRPAEK